MQCFHWLSFGVWIWRKICRSRVLLILNLQTPPTAIHLYCPYSLYFVFKMHSKSDSLGYLKDQKREIFRGLCPLDPLRGSECSPKPETLRCSLHSSFPDSRFACGSMSDSYLIPAKIFLFACSSIHKFSFFLSWLSGYHIMAYLMHKWKLLKLLSMHKLSFLFW